MTDNELGLRRVPVYVSMADLVQMKSLIDDPTLGWKKFWWKCGGLTHKWLLLLMEVGMKAWNVNIVHEADILLHVNAFVGLSAWIS